eukprot:g25266.t1
MEQAVTLSDITIRRDAESGPAVLATIAGLSARFDLAGALLGRPAFKNFHLDKPELFLSRSSEGRLQWSDRGLLSDAIDSAEADGGGQRIDPRFDAAVGDVQVSDGTIEIVDDVGGGRHRIEAIYGNLEWASLAAPAEIEGDLTVRGHRISLDFRSPQPLLLLAGMPGQLEGRAASDMAGARLNGAARLTSRGYFSGDAELQVRDVPAMLRWIGVDPARTDGLVSASVAAKVIADDNELRFDDLTLDLNDEHATGLLELDMPEGRPSRLSGTLAFNHIDLLRFLAAIEPAVTGKDEGLPSLIEGLDLDLRISAQAASLASVQFHDVALGLLNVAHQFRLDVLDSDLRPGQLTGRITTLKDADQAAVAIRVAVKDADVNAFAQALKLPGPTPTTLASADLSIDLPRSLDQRAWKAATGAVRLEAGPGRLDGISLLALETLATQKSSFSLVDVGGGSFEFDNLRATAKIHDGIMDIEQADMTAQEHRLSVAGAIPLFSGELALSAVLTPADGRDALRMTIGGAWPALVVSPASPASGE